MTRVSECYSVTPEIDAQGFHCKVSIVKQIWSILWRNHPSCTPVNGPINLLRVRKLTLIKSPGRVCRRSRSMRDRSAWDPKPLACQDEHLFLLSQDSHSQHASPPPFL